MNKKTMALKIVLGIISTVCGIASQAVGEKKEHLPEPKKEQ